jgi:hypothetical protein
VAVLKEWKSLAESVAAKELERHVSLIPDLEQVFLRLERRMPDLLAEMRNDLANHPLAREFFLGRKNVVYSAGPGEALEYFYEEHPDLESKMRILENHGLISDITRTNVPRYVMSEDLAIYLGAE